MTLFVLVLVVIVFGGVVLVGAPYLPTFKRQTEAAFKLLDLKPDQTLLELGSGDGRVMREAAKRGYQVVGFEINPILVAVSYATTWRYRSKVKIIWGNYWRQSWPTCDGIFVFLIDRYLEKLDKKIKNEVVSPVRLASFAFKIPGKKVSSRSRGIFLYEYK